MSVNYNVNVRNSRLQQVESAMDAGGSNGFLRLLDVGGNVLSSLPLSFPAATVANGILQFSNLSLIDPSAAHSGLATAARIEDSTGTVVVSGLTVGPPGTLTDIIFSPSNAIVAGTAVALQQATITGN